MYSALYQAVNIVWISRFCRETKKIIINGEEYLSLRSRSDRSAVVMAKWVGLIALVMNLAMLLL